ncbi:unnamed protein product [Arctogadus glacialis]
MKNMNKDRFVIYGLFYMITERGLVTAGNSATGLNLKLRFEPTTVDISQPVPNWNVGLRRMANVNPLLQLKGKETQLCKLYYKHSTHSINLPNKQHFVTLQHVRRPRCSAEKSLVL